MGFYWLKESKSLKNKKIKHNPCGMITVIQVKSLSWFKFQSFHKWGAWIQLFMPFGCFTIKPFHPLEAPGVFLYSHRMPCWIGERAKPSQFQRCCSSWYTRLCKSLGFPAMISRYEELSTPMIHALMLLKDLLPRPACNPHSEQRIYHPDNF